MPQSLTFMEGIGCEEWFGHWLGQSTFHIIVNALLGRGGGGGGGPGRGGAGNGSGVGAGVWLARLTRPGVKQPPASTVALGGRAHLNALI